MRLMILSGVLAVMLPFTIALLATKKRVGLDVSERFLERLDEIPSGETAEQRKLTADNLRRWVADHETSAAQYAGWVMPIDVLYLLALGSFLGLASNWLATDLQWPASFAGIPVRVWLWSLPALYMAADLIEDAMIVRFMTNPWTITAGSLRAQIATKGIKIGSVALGMLQTALLALVAIGCKGL